VNRPRTPGTPGGLVALRRGEPPSAALELFYDLVFVAAVVVLSDSFSHSPSPEDLAWLSVVFAMIWIVWLQTALLFNLCSQRPDISTHDLVRVLVLAQMLLLILAAVSAADGVELHAEYVGPLFAALLVVLGGMYAFVGHRAPELATVTRRRVIGAGAGAVLFALTPLYPDPWYLGPWILGAFLVVVPALQPDPFDGRRIDTEHLVERFGAFTIIMLGETFVKAGLTASEGQMEGLDLIVVLGTFLIVFSIWWLYFADVPRSGPPSSHGGHLGWMFIHLPLHLAIVGVAVGVAKVMYGEETVITPDAIPYLTVPLVVVLVCLAVLEGLSGDRGPDRVVTVILGAAALVAIVGLIGRFTDPSGLELTSLALAAIMIGAAMLGRRLRPGA
jgi:low temperature requirement protein LtrA